MSARPLSRFGSRRGCRLQRRPSLSCGVEHRNSPRVDCRTGHHRIAETARGDRRTQETREEGLARITTTARELYDEMLQLYPNRANPGSLWRSAHAAKP